MINIALIPIDNRPVCYQLPKQIASLSKDCNLILPDIKLLGDLNHNADIDIILKWLENLTDIDIIIISLDTIAYGGLIPSRRSNDKFDVIKSRIDKLKEIIEKKNSKVYAFSSIMRISNNNINEEEKEYWNLYGKKIFEYSYNLHKNKKMLQSGGLSVIDEITTEIPKDILSDYLETRKRNFKINKYYIELKRLGYINTLVFSKDDCSEYGLNVEEAENLKELSKGISEIYIKTGADEIPLSLLSRVLNKDKRIKIASVYTNPDYINKISKYEDISVKESVESQIELAGGIVTDEKNCDLILLVNNFKEEQGELVMNVNVPLFNNTLVLPDKPYFIADILNANGSDNDFIKALFTYDSLKEFYGYSAWNTTGNTLGSAIAAALTYFGAKHPNKDAFELLQLTRFLDDWAYQANVRTIIRNNSENLSATVLKMNMHEFEKIIYNKFGIKKHKIEYKFPWQRFFEIEINIKKRYIKIPFIDILFYE